MLLIFYDYQQIKSIIQDKVSMPNVNKLLFDEMLLYASLRQRPEQNAVERVDQKKPIKTQCYLIK